MQINISEKIDKEIKCKEEIFQITKKFLRNIKTDLFLLRLKKKYQESEEN